MNMVRYGSQYGKHTHETEIEFKLQEWHSAAPGSQPDFPARNARVASRRSLAILQHEHRLNRGRHHLSCLACVGT